MKDVFKNHANKWDTEQRIARSKEFSKIIKSFLKEESYNSAMEFGAGTGLISFNLVDIFNDITLVDISEAMLNVANEKIELNNIENVTTLKIDLNSDTIDNKFDVIYTSLALHHVEDYKNVIKVLMNHLNDGGHLIIIDLDDKNNLFHKTKDIEKEHDKAHFDGFNEGEMVNYLNEIGFSVVSSPRTVEIEIGVMSLLCMCATK